MARTRAVAYTHNEIQQLIADIEAMQKSIGKYRLGLALYFSDMLLAHIRDDILPNVSSGSKAVDTAAAT